MFGFQNRINYWEKNVLTFLIQMILADIFFIKNDEVGFLIQLEMQWVWTLLFHFPGHVWSWSFQPHKFWVSF